MCAWLCILVFYIHTFVCVYVNANVILTFMYACMDSILYVIRIYKIGPAPLLGCAPLIYNISSLKLNLTL